MVGSCLVPSKGKGRCIAVVVPHGGYLTSSKVMGKVYSLVEPPRTAVVLSPNHTGVGWPVSLATRGVWQTPLGELAIHEKLARAILKETPLAKEDAKAHQDEHAVEVQLPFLQRMGRGVHFFVPLVIQEADSAVANTLAQGLAQALRKSKEEILLVLSVNLSRYEPQEAALEKDQAVLERILHLDEEGLWEVARVRSLSMCGLTTLAVGVAAAKALGARRATQAAYEASCEPTGEPHSVVGYAGVLIR